MPRRNFKRNQMSNPLRILYAAGPGDVIGTYQHWVKGTDDPSQVAVTYSSQFYDVCQSLQAPGYIIASHANAEQMRDGAFVLEHRPVLWQRSPGVLFHMGQVWYGLRLIVSAVRFRATVVIVADGTTHWFVLRLLPLLGIRVIPSLHCVLWRTFQTQRRVEALLWRLNCALFRHQATAILAVSDSIAQQVDQLTDGHHSPVALFVPLYRREQFADLAPPSDLSPNGLNSDGSRSDGLSQTRSPFRVLFAGRIESEKGVFDLLTVAKRLARESHGEIVFDICGDGAALNELRQAVQDADLESVFFCYGYCNQTQMRQRYEQSHVVIAPTRTDFVEGLNKVVVEGVLAGRPVVTSATCPALSYVREAVIEVPPEDLQGYGDALLKLWGDRNFYQRKQQACLTLQERFYDPSRSWAATLKTILRSLPNHSLAKTTTMKIERQSTEPLHTPDSSR